jgi:serine/threonine protein kinase/formylglycine-generating enzyme required for sulfatase activity
VTSGELDTGARIGRYVIIERVGTGAMGVVYGAYDPELDRKVALKLIKPGQGVKDTARARLLREAKAIARLQHPNVVAVHDVGIIDDQVFLAMEFVAGGTIKSWLAETPRSWREILGVFIAAGRGLAAAHAAGLVHRDFKPDNVLLDKEHRPRVVDFGIARQAGAGDDELASETGDVISQDGTETLRDSSGRHALATLTKTGTWVGTPAYMAPEQFLGERGDERSDQFSFCVALYEALYGERPFAGDDMLSISVNVTTEQLRPQPKDRGVPAWVRRVILRGLRATPSDRWDAMPELIAALSSDPVAKLRNRLIAGVTAAVVLTVVIGAWQTVSSRRAQSEREIARYIDEANRSVATAQTKALEARAHKSRALADFDAMDANAGESLWRQVRALLLPVDGAYDQAERNLEAAYMLDQSRREHRTRLADIRYEHLLFAQEFRLGGKVTVLEERLSTVDVDGNKRKMLAAPGTLVVKVDTPGAQIALERYDSDFATGRRLTKPVGPVAKSTPTKLAPGFYRLLLTAAGRADVIYPFEVRPAEEIAADLTPPPAASVPHGFVFVPPGDFLFGDADEQLRTQFLNTVPIHRRRGAAFLIAAHETTYGDWIDFLNALPSAERARSVPDVSAALRGSLRLQDKDGVWHFTFQPTTVRYSAPAGEPIRYVGRKELAQQDWRRFPVAGISPVDAERYVQWLRSTQRVPGARLCTEAEWERAARGGDDRVFPHGDGLTSEDANFDATYGRVETAIGPDEVGRHPASRSPFGIDDMAGNVFELTVSSEGANQYAIRGGAYHFNSATCRSTNREVVSASFRDVTTGLRICASVEGAQ